MVSMSNNAFYQSVRLTTSRLHKRLSRMMQSMNDKFDAWQRSSSVIFIAVGDALSMSFRVLEENAEPSFLRATKISSIVLNLKHSLIVFCIILSFETSIVQDKLSMGHLSVNKLIAAFISFKFGDLK